ncbi:MAG: choice-of-anchor A family protein [Erysipelotrichaceae bacterium]|nr:choice-of-anchor A family protein [Erysipelotrichaceae bacterium]
MKYKQHTYGIRILSLLLTVLMAMGMWTPTVLAKDYEATEYFTVDTAAPWHSRASVTLDDGSVIDVEAGDYTIFTEQVKLSVVAKETKGNVKINHGEMETGYLKYEVSILDADGNLMDNGAEFWLTIRNNAVKSDWDFVVTNAGETQEYTNVVAQDGSIGIPTTTWWPLIGAKGSVITVYAGKYCLSQDTFTSIGGKYDIDYILSTYNVFTPGDYAGSHVAGPVIIGGDAGSTSLGGINNPDETYEGIKDYKHEVPSYIGELSQGEKQILTNNKDIPLYLSSKEKGNSWSVVYNQWKEKENDNYWYTENFIDWDKAMKAIKKQASDMADETGHVVVSLKKTETPEANGSSETRSLKEEEPAYTVKDDVLYLKGGNTFELTAKQLSELKEIDFVDSYDGDPVYVIVKDEGSITVPTLKFGGDVNTRNMQEALVPCNIVWVCPNATEFNVTEMTGHLVAPNATAKYNRGHYEGCVIAESFYGPIAEGHHWRLENEKTPDPVSVTPQVQKVVDGDDAPAENFTFEISAISPAELPKDYEVKATCGAGETAEFGELTFDTVGKYQYQIVENEPEEAVEGMHYSSETIVMTVTVTENKDTGELEAKVKYKNGTEESNTITNIYRDSTSTTYELFVKKEVVSVTYGVTAPTGKEFLFGLTPGEDTPDAPMPKGTKDGMKVITITDEGQAGFGTMTFTEEGDYTYIIKELVPDDADTEYTGFAFDDTEYAVTITVEENEETFELEVTNVTEAVAIGSGKKGAKFTNEYDPVVDLQIPVTKTVSGVARYFDEPTEFTFTLTAIGDAPMPEDAKDGKITMTVTDSQKKGYTETKNFPVITYLEATRPGEKWEYTITETDGGVKGFTYSDKEYRAEVTVHNTEEHPELLFTTVTYYEVKEGGELSKVENVAFTNKYEREPATLEIPVTKIVEGEERMEETTFTFTIKTTNGAPLPKKTTVKITDDGTEDFIETGYFGEIEYNEATPEDEPYIYEVSETKGGDKNDGWINSKAVYVVYVTVTNDGQGGLEVREKYFEKSDLDTRVEEPEFINSYDSGRKVLPVTADSSSMVIWYGTMLMAICGLAVACEKKRKYTK